MAAAERRLRFRTSLLLIQEYGPAASGVKYATAYSRIRNYGWPAERAFPNLRPETLKRYTQIKPETLHR